jgi:outer membrane receptor protein involved in Fe transport
VDSNIKASYYKALNKPGFLEIVPFLDNRGDYTITGNSELKNAVADNYDLRYEYLPNQIDQLLAGVFYKKINNAIEEGFQGDGHGNNNLTFINSNALNYGLELDGVKYIREFGIKCNYTWTHSITSSPKQYHADGVLKKNTDSTLTVWVQRPLSGQSEHVANISFLYKGVDNGISTQIALSYNGDRIVKVSSDLNGDMWQKGFVQLDCSAEKRFKTGFSIFAKAKNLLNTHSIWYIKYHLDSNNIYPNHENETSTTLIRNEFTDSSILLGLRYKFN